MVSDEYFINILHISLSPGHISWQKKEKVLKKMKSCKSQRAPRVVFHCNNSSLFTCASAQSHLLKGDKM